MNKICGYSCEHNKGGVCQITMCDKQIYITNRTNEQKQIKSKENIAIIRALNNFGRVPEQHELLDEIENLRQKLQRKDNEIKQLREDIVNHIKIASEYKEQMIRKDNIINELEKWLNENNLYKTNDNILAKLKELENE